MEADAYIFPVLGTILIIASALDLYLQKIPNILTFPTILGAATYHGYSNSSQGLYFSLSGLGIGIFLLILPYAMGGMGAGDVKLMGAVGSLIGAKGVFIAFLITALFGGVYAIVIILLNREIFKGYFINLFHTVLGFVLTKKYMPEPLIEHENKPRLYYGVVIALGTFTYMGLTIAGYDFSI